MFACLHKHNHNIIFNTYTHIIIHKFQFPINLSSHLYIIFSLAPRKVLISAKALQFNVNYLHTLSLSLSVCVCVCVCVCLRPSTVKALSVWIRWDTREQINDVVLKTLDSSAGFLHRYFGMQNLTFQLTALSCSYTRSMQSLDLTSIRLAFRTQGLHSPLRGVTFGTHYVVSSFAFASALTRGFAIYLGRARVTTNFSNESSPRQNTQPNPSSFISVSENVIFYLQRRNSSTV